MTKSLLFSTLILLSAVIIESSILSNLTFLRVVPDLVLLCSIYFSLLNGRLYGETTGFISGLLLDFVTGVPLGFNCLFRTLIGYLFGFFSNTIILSGFIMPVLSAGIATIIKNLFCIFIILVYPNLKLNSINIISYDFLFEFIMNVILAPFVFKLLSFFKDSLILGNKEIPDNV